jgi:hypothetical protein
MTAEATAVHADDDGGCNRLPLLHVSKPRRINHTDHPATRFMTDGGHSPKHIQTAEYQG